MRQNKRIGIMGGTFDPVHYGHLVAAESARCSFALEQVIFVPSGQPPHKRERRVSSAEERLAMTELAIADNPYFVVSDWEVKRDRISYTYDTLRAFRQKYGDDTELFFIIGADSALQLMQWRKFEEFADYCSFIAATRPGYRLEDCELPEKLANKLFFAEVPQLDISSSDIRRRVAEGEPIKYLLPTSVEKYIFECGLYKSVDMSTK
jgi:nicotinate-nucleotide adenylyltransferase